MSGQSMGKVSQRCTELCIYALALFALLSLLISCAGKFAEKEKEALKEACQHGDLEKVKEIIEKNPEFVNALIDNSASYKDEYAALNHSGESTPLNYAISNDHYDIVKYLLEKGADPNIKTRMNLHITKGLFRGKPQEMQIGGALGGTIATGNVKMAKLLIEYGADVNAVSDTGKPLIFSVIFALRTAEYEDSYFNTPESDFIGMLKLFVDNGVNLWAVDSKGRTVMHRCAERGSPEAAKILVKAGANINVKDNKGRTPLTVAKQFMNKEMVAYLKSIGATE